jgi:hypothetical protein
MASVRLGLSSAMTTSESEDEAKILDQFKVRVCQ